jgi:hypothetical protein
MFKNLMIACALLWTGMAVAVEKKEGERNKILRVGGVYEVASIKEVDHGFKIEFKATAKTGKFDTLILESDHVHFSVKEGQKLRISAEVLSSNGRTAEVSQVLLFLPHEQGVAPVWMLSRKSPGELEGSKYLEMHAPQADYTIL